MEPDITVVGNEDAGVFLSQRKAAKFAGVTYLLATAIVVTANFSIQQKLLVENKAGEAARNILDHENLFRFGTLCYLIYGLSTVAVLSSFYIILRPVSRLLALLAALLRFVYALTWIVIVINFFMALRILTNTDHLQALETNQLQDFAKLFLSGYYIYYVGLLFWSTASILCGFLWMRSGYIPGLLAIFGFISSLWCVMCTLIFIVYPNFSEAINLWWFDSPMAVFEIILSFWLLIKGIRISR